MASNFFDAPAQKLISITPSDSTDDASGPFRAVYVGVSGDLKVRDMYDNPITLVGLAGGLFHPVCCKRIYSTGTTATSILGVPVNDHVK